MADRILYVSDLDGTLLRNDMTVSPYTVATINRLVEKGLGFTYATARSIEIARTVTSDLRLKLPVITRNGAVLADNTDGRAIRKNLFSQKDISFLKSALSDIAPYGFVSSFFGEKMDRLYLDAEHSEGLAGYIDYYRDDNSMYAVDDIDSMFGGNPCYVTLIGDREDIEPIYERLKNAYELEYIFQKDIYRDEYWLDITPKDCTKAKTLLRLKEELGFDKLVIFGDSLNDMSMFKIADECYAVANAIDDLKNAATGVIGSNEEDAVARFLEERAAEI